MTIFIKKYISLCYPDFSHIQYNPVQISSVMRKSIVYVSIHLKENGLFRSVHRKSICVCGRFWIDK